MSWRALFIATSCCICFNMAVLGSEEAPKESFNESMGAEKIVRGLSRQGEASKSVEVFDERNVRLKWTLIVDVLTRVLT